VANNIWTQLAIWYLDGCTQCQLIIICNYCGLELHWPKERSWSWQPVASGNASCCGYIYNYLLTICILHFFLFFFVPTLVEWFRTQYCMWRASEKKKSKEKRKHKKHFNFTQSYGISHRIPLRLPTTTSSAHRLADNQTCIILIYIIRVSVQRPYIVILITCRVTCYIILFWSLKLQTTRYFVVTYYGFS
jgi:hypothetical protein